MEILRDHEVPGVILRQLLARLVPYILPLDFSCGLLVKMRFGMKMDFSEFSLDCSVGFLVLGGVEGREEEKKKGKERKRERERVGVRRSMLMVQGDLVMGPSKRGSGGGGVGGDGGIGNSSDPF